MEFLGRHYTVRPLVVGILTAAFVGIGCSRVRYSGRTSPGVCAPQSPVKGPVQLRSLASILSNPSDISPKDLIAYLSQGDYRRTLRKDFRKLRAELRSLDNKSTLVLLSHQLLFNAPTSCIKTKNPLGTKRLTEGLNTLFNVAALASVSKDAVQIINEKWTIQEIAIAQIILYDLGFSSTGSVEARPTAEGSIIDGKISIGLNPDPDDSPADRERDQIETVTIRIVNKFGTQENKTEMQVSMPYMSQANRHEVTIEVSDRISLIGRKAMTVGVAASVDGQAKFVDEIEATPQAEKSNIILLKAKSSLLIGAPAIDLTYDAESGMLCKLTPPVQPVSPEPPGEDEASESANDESC